MADNTNGRVTNAVLSTKLDSLIEKVDEYHKDHDALEKRVRVNETDVAKIKERLNLFAGVQAGLSLAFSVVAGWFGAQK